MSSKLLHIVKHDDQSFDKFFNNSSNTMLNFKRFNDTNAIKQDIRRRQMNSVNSSTCSKRINRFVYMPVMDTSFSSAILSSRPNTINKLSRQNKNETISSSSKSDQETNTSKFSSNNIVYNMTNNDNNKTCNFINNNYNKIDFKSCFNNRTSTPISNDMHVDKSHSRNYSNQKNCGFSNKDFLDLIVVLKTTNSSNNSRSQRKKDAN